MHGPKPIEFREALSSFAKWRRGEKLEPIHFGAAATLGVGRRRGGPVRLAVAALRCTGAAGVLASRLATAGALALGVRGVSVLSRGGSPRIG